MQCEPRQHLARDETPAVLKETEGRRFYRRFSPAKSIRFTATVTGTGANLDRRPVTDISLGGIGLRASRIEGWSIRVGETVMVALELNRMRVSVAARLVHRRNNTKGIWRTVDVGIQFDWSATGANARRQVRDLLVLLVEAEQRAAQED